MDNDHHNGQNQKVKWKELSSTNQIILSSLILNETNKQMLDWFDMIWCGLLCWMDSTLIHWMQNKIGKRASIYSFENMVNNMLNNHYHYYIIKHISSFQYWCINWFPFQIYTNNANINIWTLTYVCFAVCVLWIVVVVDDFFIINISEKTKWFLFSQFITISIRFNWFVLLSRSITASIVVIIFF